MVAAIAQVLLHQPLEGRALVHGHCHQKALWGMDEDLALLAAAKLDVSAPDSGCCGMSGAFGMKPGTYEASVKIAQRSLLPSLQGIPAEAFVVANGFSCREQIEGLAGRRTLHLAELLARTLA